MKNTTESDAQRKINFLSEKSGIHTRHSVVNDFSISEDNPTLFKSSNELASLSDRMQLYKREALDLAQAAILKIKDFQNLKNSITHLITVTCTGLFAPGLDIELIEKLELNPKTQRSSINFMGCNAAILALNSANAICKSTTNAKVLIVCVELCTIHFQNSSKDDYILANTLFGDGAAAAIVSSNPTKENNISIKAFNSLIIPQGKKDMAWQLSETGFLMNLTSYVSELINGNMLNFLKDIDLLKSNIDFYAIHPGGKKIVDEFVQTLSLKKEQLQASYDVLSDYGNMSSPTILFVLKKVLENLLKSDKGKVIFCAAFGPGLSIETMQLEYV